MFTPLSKQLVSNGWVENAFEIQGGGGVTLLNSRIISLGTLQ